MEKYCWDKEKIIASNLDEQAKEIILGELDNIYFRWIYR